MDRLLQDIRYALRSLRKNPGFALVAVLTLALGIGANSAIFSVINGVLLHPLPFRDADRLAMVWIDNQPLGIRQDITSYPTYQDWRDQNRVFSDMAAFRPHEVNLTGGFEPERIARTAVTATFFGVLGVEPVRGRGFTAEEEQEGNDRVAVLSHGLWQRRFGGDPGVIGTTVQMNEQEFSVVGIAPRGFGFPANTELWIPLAPSEQVREARGVFWLYTIGRLQPGVTMEMAQTEMSGIAARIGQEYEVFSPFGVFVQPVRDYLVGDVRTALLVLLGAVAFLLLIASANVANLLLARASAREREIAVRTALGASRGRITAQLLTESVVLGLAGGALGLLFAVGGVRVLRALSPADLPRIELVQVDSTVLGFTFLIALLTGIAFGLVPSLQVSGNQLTETLREGGRGMAGSHRGRRTRKALVVGEVALALVLLIGAGLLIQSFARLRSVDPGFQPENVLTVRLALGGSQYMEPARVIGFYDELLGRVQQIPGVASAAAASDILLPELANSARVTIEGRATTPAEEAIEVPIDAVTPGFFRTFGTPLLRGRDFAATDTEESTLVAIINETMARRFWPDTDPIGKRYRYGTGPDNQSPWRTVVGVVADARRSGVEQEARPSTFLPHRQRPSPAMTLLVRTTADPLALVSAVRREVREIDPNQPMAEIATLEALLSERLAQRRFNAVLLGVFSALALLLAIVGVYGVIAYMVNQSTREIGIRMALGARSVDVLRLVLRQVSTLVLLGIGIGVATALVLSRTLSGMLFGTSPTDPATYVGIALLLTVTALIASYLPARRATRVDPMIALRAE
jgi:putative ABC transport system permease protein